MATVNANFLQGFIIDMNKISLRKRYPNDDPMTWFDSIIRCLPREAYRYTSAGNVDGELTMVFVLDAGDDEEYLRKTLKIPDNESFRQAVEYFMTPGVWPTHEWCKPYIYDSTKSPSHVPFDIEHRRKFEWEIPQWEVPQSDWFTALKKGT